jgi:hypothetical protein
MRNFLTALLALLVVSGTDVPVALADAPWRVTQVEGVVRVTAPGSTVADVRLNTPLVVGAIVTTGANSRATVENGAQRIVMTANSRMTIAPEADGITRILQDLGSLLFQVDHRQSPHFVVETPLLAAVVKGTTFSVTTGGAEDSVHVTQGLVEVRAQEGGAATDVAAGMMARVSRGAPALVSSGAASNAATAAGTASGVPTLDYAAASEGLLNAGERVDARGANPAAIAGAGSAAGNATNPASILNNIVAWVTGNGNGNHRGNGNPGNPPGNGNPGNPPGNGNPGNPPGNGNPGNPPGNGNPGNPPGNGNPGNPPGNGNPGNPPGNPPATPPGRPGNLPNCPRC